MVLDASGNPLYDAVTGAYIGGVVWLKTLGEYAEVEADDLKASLADFRTICDRLPHLVWTCDAEGQLDWFGKSWYDFTGFTEEQSLGLGFTDAIDPEDMKNVWTQFSKAKESKSELHAEAKYRRHDGQWIWMYVRAKPAIDRNGKVLKWYGTSTDIQSLVLERKEAQRKKLQLMEMLSHCDIGLFEASPEGHLHVLEGKMGWFGDLQNSRTLESLDESRGEGVDKLKKGLPEVSRGLHESAEFECKVEGRWYRIRLVRDGLDEEGHRIAQETLGCSIDITEQKERAGLELENARLISEASLEMEKSRLKTSFLAHMSHEIRTPIAGITGLADILAESCPDSKQQDCIKDIQVSAENLLTIVNDILDLSKIEAGQLQLEAISYNVHDLVTQVQKLFIHTAKNKSLELTCRVDTSGELDLIGDPNRVKQILTNLVSNALKFTSKGTVDISVKPLDGKFQIVVQDTGEGIDDETMSLLFRPFAQGDASTARRHGGTGLGLMISRNLADKMGGTLTLESEPSKGTKAILVLPKRRGFGDVASPGNELRNPMASEVPFRPPLSAANTTANPTGEESRSSKRLVLIVEDNAINQKVAVNFVEKLGYQTKAVWNGQEALDFLEAEDEPEPSVVLMDCQVSLSSKMPRPNHEL